MQTLTTSEPFSLAKVIERVKGIMPRRIRSSIRWTLDSFTAGVQASQRQWRIATFLPRLRWRDAQAYDTLMRSDLPAGLRRIVFTRLATEAAWRAWPDAKLTAKMTADVLFVSYRAHPDLVKQCIALKREIPGLRCALVVENHAHTERLCRQWFDDVVVFGKLDEPRLLEYLRQSDAKVVILRYRGVLLNLLARVFRRGPLIYSPPGYYLSSRSDDYNELADREMTFPEILEADKYLLERVQGVVHFLSDAAFDWFREKAVNLRCPAATIYVACLPELEPHTTLPKLSEKDGEWHLVHATGVPPITDSSTANAGSNAILPLWKCEQVVSQGVHLHVYGTYFDRRARGYAPYVELEQRSAYFHLENLLEFDDLLTAMTQYDYAWKHWDMSDVELWPAFRKYLTPNFHAYVQSGLPMLMSPMGPALEVEMTQKFGVGVLVAEPELPRLKEILDGHRKELPEMRRRVEETKNTVFSYDTKALLNVVGPYLQSGPRDSHANKAV